MNESSEGVDQPGAGSGATAGGPEPATHDVRRLLRRRDGRVVGGVAGGVADYAAVDPVAVRVGFAALALGGVGLPLYLALWALLPDQPGGESIGETLLRRVAGTPVWFRVALLVLAVLAAPGSIGSVSTAVVILLVVVAVAAQARGTRPASQG